MSKDLDVDPAYTCAKCGAHCEDLLSPVCYACRQKMTLVSTSEYEALQARIAKLRWALGRSANQVRVFKLKRELRSIGLLKDLQSGVQQVWDARHYVTTNIHWMEDDFESWFQTEDYSGCVRGLDDDEWMVWLRDVNQEIFDLRTHGVLDRASGKALVEHILILDQEKKRGDKND